MDLNAYLALAQSGLLQQIEKPSPAAKMPSPLPVPQLSPQLYCQMLYQQLFLQQLQQQQQQQAIFGEPKNGNGFHLANLLNNSIGAASNFSPLMPGGQCSAVPSTSQLNSATKNPTDQNDHQICIQKPIPIKADVSPIVHSLVQNLIKEEPAMTAISSAPTTLTPEATPSPREETSRPSPPASASSARHSQEDQDDDDDEMYIDVEDVEDKESGKNKRKAHIEFYRKVKALRHRTEKRLQCAKCEAEIINNDASVTEHVQAHANSVSFRCLVCGWEAAMRTAMYAHMKEKHPKKPSSFSDRRDMTKLCALIAECFPKVGPKIVRQSLTGYVDNLVKELSSRGIDKAKCKLCEKKLPIDKSLIAKHIHSHPAYRCKTCKYTSSTSEEQTEHLLIQHNISDPKLSLHFNQCTAADALGKSFQRCFGDLLQ